MKATIPFWIGVVIGIGVGGIGVGLLWFVSDTGWFRQRRTIRPPLPPATPRQINPAQRANRADLRAARGWVSPSLDDFEHEETH